MKKIVFVVLTLVAAVGYIIWRAQPISVEPNGISKDQARALILECRAKGVYSYHSGEAGLVLDANKFQKVNGATREELEAMKNPICPFTTAVME